MINYHNNYYFLIEIFSVPLGNSTLIKIKERLRLYSKKVKPLNEETFLSMITKIYLIIVIILAIVPNFSLFILFVYHLSILRQDFRKKGKCLPDLIWLL